MYLFIAFVLLILIGIFIHIQIRSAGRIEKIIGGKKLSKKSKKSNNVKSAKTKLNKNKKYTIDEFMEIQAKNYASNMGIDY